MKSNSHPSFRRLMAEKPIVRIAGVHDGLGGKLAESAGFDAVWSSSFEVSASRALPDASLLSMAEYLEAAQNIQSAIGIPVVADCDTGYGNNLNVAHMVHRYERAGITAVAIEDKHHPKMNSFADAHHALLTMQEFSDKIATAKGAQASDDFYVIARTEAMIAGLGVDEALERCAAYVAAGADAVLAHSKSRERDEIEAFLAGWDGSAPVVIVPTTYPDWQVDAIGEAGASAIIYANQGLRSSVRALEGTFATILREGSSQSLESDIASVQQVFDIQDLSGWQDLTRS
jgi:phosphoenolpyruvate phosphomutase